METPLQLAMLTLGTTAAIATFSMAGKKVEKAKGPPINATNKEEEAFIAYVEIIAFGDE